ncbi:MAG: hypothetical protein IKP00_17420 [Victivallales bacterium]|nr:hypothetical protein [Victivallales bacterium]
MESTSRGNLKGNYILEFPDDIIPHWSMARIRRAASLRYAARRKKTGMVI